MCKSINEIFNEAELLFAVRKGQIVDRFFSIFVITLV